MTNFVVVIADDMRASLLDWMPLTRSFGAVFPNAYNANPACHPSRVSAYTGCQSRTTGVYSNNPPAGGYDEWHASGGEDRTIANALAQVGYRCALMGKYHGYNPVDAGFIPPGYSDWLAITTAGSDYFDVGFSKNGEEVTSPPGVYLTDFLADEAWKFIEARSVDEQPFFLWLAPVSPHKEHVPAPRHSNLFGDLSLPLPPSFDVPSTGPSFYSSMTEMEKPVEHMEWVYRNMVRCVLSLDEMVARVVQALQVYGLDDDTVVIFCSDNGFMFGEHRLYAKSVPYLEATRSPFVVRSSGMPLPPSAGDALVQTIDIAPTFAELAGIDFPCDGKSLVPVLERGAPSREMLYLESLTHSKQPSYVQAQRRRRTYTLHSTGEEEFYELDTDPYQVANRVAQREGSAALEQSREFVRSELEKGAPPGWPL